MLIEWKVSLLLLLLFYVRFYYNQNPKIYNQFDTFQAMEMEFRGDLLHFPYLYIRSVQNRRIVK